jgi:class 3 adenylate cyclase
MINYPQPIVLDLIELSLRDRQIAYLEMNYKGLLLSHGGDLEAFGLQGLEAGSLIEHQLDIFTGLIDPECLPLYLPFIEMPSGESADIHMFEKSKRIWVLLMHTGEKKKYHQAIQQKNNELRLTHSRQARILNEHLGREVAVRLERSMEHINRSGERRNLTIMFADLRGFTALSERSSPEKLFEVLNIYLTRMISVSLMEGGVVDKIIGDEVMAVFGMLNQRQNGSVDAVKAAIHILTSIESLNRSQLLPDDHVLQVGIGIATGPVALGVLGSRHRKSLTVVGNHVNLAARLQGQAAGKQLIIDGASFRALGDEQAYFTPQQVELKGYSGPLDVHQLDLENLDFLEKRLVEHEEDPTIY